MRNEEFLFFDTGGGASGGFWLPDPRWEEPNLLTPGKQPVGPMVIDWTHPMTRELIGFFVPSGAGIVDLVSNISCELANGAVPVVNGNGRAIYGTGTNVEHVKADHVAPLATNLSEGSLFWSGKILRSFVNDWFLGFGDASDNFVMFYLNTETGGVVRFFARDTSGGESTSATTTTQFTDLEFHAWGGSNGPAGAKAYADGELQGTGTEATSTAYPVDKFTIGALGRGSYSNTTGCETNVAGVWNRQISDVEMASIHRNPYQFLIPA